MALSNAERQAAYRARKRQEADPGPKAPRADAAQRIVELEAEVRHLKQLLSQRHPFGSPRPAPKPSRSR